jgi:transposase
MQVQHARCAGLDVHKKTVVACILITSPDGQVQRYRDSFSTMTRGLLALDDWLSSHEVSQVAMESTGIYWRPVFTILEANRSVMVVNAQHLKAVPGRKTDVKDAEWIAELLRHGLLQPSFIPPLPVRILRDLTRHRKTLVQSRTQELNRLQKALETANIKLDLVVTDIVGVSSRRMITALSSGVEDVGALAELAKGSLRGKRPQLRLALEGRVQEHQRFLFGMLLEHIEYLERLIHRVEVEIEAQVSQYEEAIQLLLTLPASGRISAAMILGEIGTDMSRFPSAKHLASWAGVCPGNRQSAGKRLSGATTPGNAYLKTVLCDLAANTARQSGTYVHALYHRLARRRGKSRARLAVAHSLLVAIYYMLRDHVPYQDLGVDYFDQLQTQRLQRHYVRRLEELGFSVALNVTG